MNWGPLSEWTEEGQPKIENSFCRHEITVWADMSGQGNAKGNLEYSSTATSRYLLREHDGLENELRFRE